MITGSNLNGRIKIKAVAMTSKIQRIFTKALLFTSHFQISSSTTNDLQFLFFFFDRLPAENYMRASATSLTKKFTLFLYPVNKPL